SRAAGRSPRPAPAPAPAIGQHERRWPRLGPKPSTFWEERDGSPGRLRGSFLIAFSILVHCPRLPMLDEGPVARRGARATLAAMEGESLPVVVGNPTGGVAAVPGELGFGREAVDGLTQDMPDPFQPGLRVLVALAVR